MEIRRIRCIAFQFNGKFSTSLKMENILTAVSLFSGAGGMDLGVIQAGFDVKACIEVDKYCCETLRENINRSGRNTKVFEGDIRSFDPTAILNALNLDVGQIDLLFGGSPCQSFSLAGQKKSLADERGRLLYQIIRYAEIFKPKAIMIEQVKGLLTSKDLHGQTGGVFKDFLAQIDSAGYLSKWRVMSAVQYGVPQLRERVFLVAMKPPNVFKFPEATHSRFGETDNLFSLPPCKTVGEVIKDLPRPIKKADTEQIPINSHYDVTPARDRQRIFGVPEGKNLSSQTHLPKEQICGLTKKDTTKFLRLSMNKPANTLRGGEIFFHPTEDRYLTPREYMRIHGFPDNYILRGPIRGRSGTFKDLDQYRQIGNSVPPPLAKIIADNIREAILCQKSMNCLDTMQTIKVWKLSN